MILFTEINNSIEFRCGPSHLKMIMLGREQYSTVQKFAASRANKTNVEFSAPSAESIVGSLHQASIFQVGVKRPR